MKMLAACIHEHGGAELLKVQRLPIPTCGDDQVMIRVKAAGVNPVDTYQRAGAYGKVPMPFIPGLDAAGTVHTVGKNVNNFKKGDRVFCTLATGCYAEFALTSVTTCWHLPSHIPFAQGAALGVPYCTAYRSLFQRAHTKPGDTVLVHGASGAVGSATVQICRSMGICVFGTAGTKGGLRMVKDLGADGVFNHREKEYIEKIKEAAGEKGITVVVEMLANTNLQTDLDLIAPGGTVVNVGARGDTIINPMATMMKESSVTGVILFRTKPAEWDEIGPFLVAGLTSGTLRPIIDKEYPLEQASRAHVDVIEHSSGSKGKIILTL